MRFVGIRKNIICAIESSTPQDCASNDVRPLDGDTDIVVCSKPHSFPTRSNIKTMVLVTDNTVDRQLAGIVILWM